MTAHPSSVRILPLSTPGGISFSLPPYRGARPAGHGRRAPRGARVTARTVFNSSSACPERGSAVRVRESTVSPAAQATQTRVWAQGRLPLPGTPQPPWRWRLPYPVAGGLPATPALSRIVFSRSSPTGGSATPERRPATGPPCATDDVKRAAVAAPLHGAPRPGGAGRRRYTQRYGGRRAFPAPSADGRRAGPAATWRPRSTRGRRAAGPSSSARSRGTRTWWAPRFSSPRRTASSRPARTGKRRPPAAAASRGGEAPPGPLPGGGSARG